MTWIASAGHKEGRFSPNGLGIDRRAAPQIDMAENAILERGTLMLETRMSPTGKPQILFGFDRVFPWSRAFSIQAIPGGGVSLVHSDHGEVCHAALRWRGTGRADVVRITFSWDAPSGWAQLSLERPEESTVISAQVNRLKPFYIKDLHDAILSKGDRTFSSDAVFIALSDEIEPVGPMPTLTLDTPIATPWGYKDLRNLARGDTVITETSGSVPILQRVTRTVPALGSFAPIRLRAPYFGLRQDVIVAPDQRLIIRGSDVEYMFGKEAVLVPARHLVNGFAARYEPTGSTVTYSHLLLAGHETLLVAGSSFESLYIGRIRRKPDQLHASSLASFERNGLPEHGKPVFPILKAFEAITLADQRAA
jgi:hypothetical protein